MVLNSTLLRGLLALLAGYATAAAWQAALARVMPMSRIDATMVATMLAFAIYAGAAVWAFAAGTVRRAAGGLAMATASALLLFWLAR